MRWSSVVLLLALFACGSAPVFNIRHEELAAVTGRTTFAFAPSDAMNEQGFTTGYLFNPIMVRRIQDELTKELTKRGYVAAPPESASLLVTFTTGGRQEIKSQGDQTGAVVRGPAYSVDRGGLVLHFLDAQTKAVLWRGWADGVLTVDDDFDKNVRRAVREIMASFPASPPSAATPPSPA